MRNKRNLDIIPVEGDILKIHISISFACVLHIVYNVKKTLVTRSTPWSAAFLQTPSYSVRAASNWIMRVGRENTLFSYFDVEFEGLVCFGWFILDLNDKLPRRSLHGWITDCVKEKLTLAEKFGLENHLKVKVNGEGRYFFKIMKVKVVSELRLCEGKAVAREEVGNWSDVLLIVGSICRNKIHNFKTIAILAGPVGQKLLTHHLVVPIVEKSEIQIIP